MKLLVKLAKTGVTVQVIKIVIGREKIAFTAVNPIKMEHASAIILKTVYVHVRQINFCTTAFAMIHVAPMNSFTQATVLVSPVMAAIKS